MDDKDIEAKTSIQYKAIVKKHVKCAAFESLLFVKSGHTKRNSISYTGFKIQPYLVEVALCLKVKEQNYSTSEQNQMMGSRVVSVLHLKINSAG